MKEICVRWAGVGRTDHDDENFCAPELIWSVKNCYLKSLYDVIEYKNTTVCQDAQTNNQKAI